MEKKIAILTMVRNGEPFLEKWIAHYSAVFGADNLYVLLDGVDQKVPASAETVNTIVLPHVPLPRAKGDRNRAAILSHFAAGLFRVFDIVIATDVDEFIALDPQTGATLAQYLSDNTTRTCLSPFGLDVGRDMESEATLDYRRPVLTQRRLAVLSARYTKPLIMFRPLKWGSGLHRVKGHNFHIDPNLYLFHLGMADPKPQDSALEKQGWAGHFKRRNKVLEQIAKATPLKGDSVFEAARRYQSRHRPLYALNKPGRSRKAVVVEIPERFRNLL